MVPNMKGENPWHCWLCNKKGRTLISLFKKIKAVPEKISELRLILGLTQKEEVVSDKTKVELLSNNPEVQCIIESLAIFKPVAPTV